MTPPTWPRSSPSSISSITATTRPLPRNCPERLDVDAFATYLAMMDLIVNFDDINGPGNNSYLYSDPVTGQITIVPWDMNLAFGPEGGGGVVEFRGVGPPPEGEDMFIVGPDGATPVATDGVPGDGPQREADGPRVGCAPRRAPTRSSSRYTGIAEYADLVAERTSTLRAELYDAGVAAEILSRWVDVLEAGATGLLDTETIASESDAIAEYFAEQ